MTVLTFFDTYNGSLTVLTSSDTYNGSLTVLRVSAIWPVLAVDIPAKHGPVAVRFAHIVPLEVSPLSHRHRVAFHGTDVSDGRRRVRVTRGSLMTGCLAFSAVFAASCHVGSELEREKMATQLDDYSTGHCLAGG